MPPPATPPPPPPPATPPPPAAAAAAAAAGVAAAPPPAPLEAAAALLFDDGTILIWTTVSSGLTYGFTAVTLLVGGYCGVGVTAATKPGWYCGVGLAYVACCCVVVGAFPAVAAVDAAGFEIEKGEKERKREKRGKGKRKKETGFLTKGSLGDDEARQVSENASLAACAQYTLFVREFAEAGKKWGKGWGEEGEAAISPPSCGCAGSTWYANCPGVTVGGYCAGLGLAIPVPVLQWYPSKSLSTFLFQKLETVGESTTMDFLDPRNQCGQTIVRMVRPAFFYGGVRSSVYTPWCIVCVRQTSKHISHSSSSRFPVTPTRASMCCTMHSVFHDIQVAAMFALHERDGCGVPWCVFFPQRKDESGSIFLAPSHAHAPSRLFAWTSYA